MLIFTFVSRSVMFYRNIITIRSVTTELQKLHARFNITHSTQEWYQKPTSWIFKINMNSFSVTFLNRRSVYFNIFVKRAFHETWDMRHETWDMSTHELLLKTWKFIWTDASRCAYKRNMILNNTRQHNYFITQGNYRSLALYTQQ